jgi:predicted MPP superfamily phosphohydrolase
VILLLGILLLAVGFYAAFIEPGSVRVTELRLAFPNLPPSFDGLRLLHLADVHWRREGKRERRIADLVAALAADIVVCTGDLHDLGKLDVSACRWLANLRQRCGVFMVPGNHDAGIHVPASRMKALLSAYGVSTLVNESFNLWRGQEQIVIVGSDDPHIGYDDIREILDHLPDSTFRVVLAHSPDVLRHLGDKKGDLVLCGHTHGGQVCVPVLGPIYTNTRRTPRGRCSGMTRLEGGTTLYVSRGVGQGSVRFLCPPEIVVIELRGAAAAGNAGLGRGV